MDYPQTAGLNAWPFSDTSGPLTPETAPEYADRLKAHLEKTLRVLIEKPEAWDPVAAGWYDMVWSGDGTPGPKGTDPNSGREALMNSYSGQIIPAETFTGPDAPTAPVQNHAVIYYNSTAATQLGKIWANIYAPNLGQAEFPKGSIVAKVEAVTNTPANWPAVEHASEWSVFRPTTQNQIEGGDQVPQVLTVRPFQMAIKVKDPDAAGPSGWVYAAFVYDKDAVGKTPWDRFVPVGLQWGNDPEFANVPNGLPPGATLRETWVNPNAPAFTLDSMGWGGRLAGPMDVATRHNVITASGKRYEEGNHFRASSCQSCHSSAEHPFTANLYPSPNRSFPRDGQPFLMFDPGSTQWVRWYQNRPGTEAISGNIGGRGLDYDMVLMFALSAFNDAMGNDGLVIEHIDVH